VAFSLAVTFATYFYSYAPNVWLTVSGDWRVLSVNRGWPLPWVVENYQALNFSLDLIFWAMVLLLPSFLYLYRKNSQEQRRML
jgi:hypothetical protein